MGRGKRRIGGVKAVAPAGLLEFEFELRVLEVVAEKERLRPPLADDVEAAIAIPTSAVETALRRLLRDGQLALAAAGGRAYTVTAKGHETLAAARLARVVVAPTVRPRVSALAARVST